MNKGYWMCTAFVLASSVLHAGCVDEATDLETEDSEASDVELTPLAREELAVDVVQRKERGLFGKRTAAGDSEKLETSPEEEAFEPVPAVQAPPPSPPLTRTVVHCASRGYQSAICPVSGPVVAVTLLNKVSRAPCVEGLTWGYDRSRGFIWVNYGCRADFAVDG